MRVYIRIYVCHPDMVKLALPFVHQWRMLIPLLKHALCMDGSGASLLGEEM
jgi:hypothetical protein